MKKFNFKRIKFRKWDIRDLDDRTLLLNLYATQILTLLIGFVIIWFQKNNQLTHIFHIADVGRMFLWGITFALIVIFTGLCIGRWVPEQITDDGGINKMLFQNRALWHIAIISAAVAICEEILFRGAVQYSLGPYWTSILFAAIHIRYLRHWLMTGLVFGISYGLGWIYMQTGTLWTPILAHFLIDFTMGCIIKYGRKP